MDIQKLTDAIGKCARDGLTQQSSQIVLKMFTEALDLASNIDWINYCGIMDPRHCMEYVDVNNPMVELAIDGRKLKDWDEKDITADAIKTAIKASAKLTPSMIKSCSKIKKKLTNELIYEFSLYHLYYDNNDICNYDWLKLWNPKGKSFEEASGISDMNTLLNILSMKDIIARSNENFKKDLDILNTLKLPETFMNIITICHDRLIAYYEMRNKLHQDRAKVPWSERNNIPEPLIPLSLDKDENEQFFALLRLHGNSDRYFYHNSIDKSPYWVDNHTFAKALLLCYTNKYQQ